MPQRADEVAASARAPRTSAPAPAGSRRPASGWCPRPRAGGSARWCGSRRPGAGSTPASSPSTSAGHQRPLVGGPVRHRVAQRPRAPRRRRATRRPGRRAASGGAAGAAARPPGRGRRPATSRPVARTRGTQRHPRASSSSAEDQHRRGQVVARARGRSTRCTVEPDQRPGRRTGPATARGSRGHRAAHVDDGAVAGQRGHRVVAPPAPGAPGRPRPPRPRPAAGRRGQRRAPRHAAPRAQARPTSEREPGDGPRAARSAGARQQAAGQRRPARPPRRAAASAGRAASRRGARRATSDRDVGRELAQRGVADAVDLEQLVDRR